MTQQRFAAEALRTASFAHPLAGLIRGAAHGVWPAADCGWTLLPAWRPGVSAIVALTGHAYVCTDRRLVRADLDRLGCNGLGGATLPAVVTAVAGPDGWIDCLDVLLVAMGRGRESAPLIQRPDLADHHRVANARRSRDVLAVVGYLQPERRDLATISRGLGGLTEIGVEAATAGHGSRLFADVLDTLPMGEVVVAGVAPGNARSLRSALAAGFAVAGSVQILLDARVPDGSAR